MKKYLMSGIAAIAVCAAFTSCSKNNDVYQGPQPEAPKTEVQKYEEAFTKAFGQLALTSIGVLVVQRQAHVL